MQLADRLDLPRGYSARPYRGQTDHAAMALVLDAYRRHHGVPERAGVEQIDHAFTGVVAADVALELAIVECDGDVVAYCHPRPIPRDGGRADLVVWAPTAPDHIGRELFDAMLAAQHDHLRGHADPAATTRWRGRASHRGPGSAPVGEAAWFEAHGYAATHWDASLRRPHLDDIPDLPLPDDIEVRPVRPDEIRTIVEEHHEAFRGEWDFAEAGPDDIDDILVDPVIDHTLWQVAWQGDTVVGQVKPYIDHAENAERGYRRGYAEYISTHHDHRNRGIAGALLARALVALRDRGMTEAVLGVDVHNPGGAFHLYRKLGFEVTGYEAYYTRPFGG